MMTLELLAHDEDMIGWVFSEIIGALGFSAWYECEEIWEYVADLMIELGLDEEEVTDYFSEMAWEL